MPGQRCFAYYRSPARASALAAGVASTLARRPGWPGNPETDENLLCPVGRGNDRIRRIDRDCASLTGTGQLARRASSTSPACRFTAHADERKLQVRTSIRWRACREHCAYRHFGIVSCMIDAPDSTWPALRSAAFMSYRRYFIYGRAEFLVLLVPEVLRTINHRCLRSTDK